MISDRSTEPAATGAFPAAAQVLSSDEIAGALTLIANRVLLLDAAQACALGVFSGAVRLRAPDELRWRRARSGERLVLQPGTWLLMSCASRAGILLDWLVDA